MASIDTNLRLNLDIRSKILLDGMRMMETMSPWDNRRYMLFMVSLGAIGVLKSDSIPVPIEAMTILRRMYNSQHEPPLYSAQAVLTLQLCDEVNASDPQAEAECLREVIRLCQSASEEERERMVLCKRERSSERSENEDEDIIKRIVNVQVGPILEELEVNAVERLEKLTRKINRPNISNGAEKRTLPECGSSQWIEYEHRCQQMRRVPSMAKWAKDRWRFFSGLLVYVYNNNYRLPTDILEILLRIQRNASEPGVYRAHAMYFHFRFDDSCINRGYTQEFMKEKYATMLKTCASIPPREKNRRVVKDEAGTMDTVGVLVEKLVEKINFEVYTNESWDKRLFMKKKNNDESFNISLKSGFMDKFHGEVIRNTYGGGEGESLLKDILYLNHVPEINSKTIERIKSLPEKDCMVYLFLKKEVECIKLYAYEVNMAKFEQGRRKNILKEVQLIRMEKDENSNTGTCTPSIQKLLVSMFVKACMNPDDMFGLRKSNLASLRPKTILLDNNDESNHPQVQTFLKMMGCSNISIVDPDIAKLAMEHDCNDDAPVQAVKPIKLIPRDICAEFPMTDAKYRGLKCFGCGEVNPHVLSCQCEKVYFCNKTCQTENWARHKKDHKRFMKKLEKKGKKGS